MYLGLGWDYDLGWGGFFLLRFGWDFDIFCVLCVSSMSSLTCIFFTLTFYTLTFFTLFIFNFILDFEFFHLYLLLVCCLRKCLNC